MVIVDQGFEVHDRESDILLVDRGTWGRGYAALVLGVTGVAFAVLGGLMLLGLATRNSDVTAYGLLGGGLGLLLPIPFLMRTIRERQNAGVDEVRAVLVLDRVSGELRDRMGGVLARLDDVEATVRVDWMTRGWGRIVTLRWPGGRRTIFRTLRRKRARAVLQLLSEGGISTR